MKVEELLAAAWGLPVAERVYLADRLLAAISPAEQEASRRELELFLELDRRVADISDVVRAEDLWRDS